MITVHSSVYGLVDFLGTPHLSGATEPNEDDRDRRGRLSLLAADFWAIIPADCLSSDAYSIGVCLLFVLRLDSLVVGGALGFVQSDHDYAP